MSSPFDRGTPRRSMNEPGNEPMPKPTPEAIRSMMTELEGRSVHEKIRPFVQDTDAAMAQAAERPASPEYKARATAIAAAERVVSLQNGLGNFRSPSLTLGRLRLKAELRELGTEVDISEHELASLQEEAEYYLSGDRNQMRPLRPEDPIGMPMGHEHDVDALLAITDSFMKDTDRIDIGLERAMVLNKAAGETRLAPSPEIINGYVQAMVAKMKMEGSTEVVSAVSMLEKLQHFAPEKIAEIRDEIAPLVQEYIRRSMEASAQSGMITPPSIKDLRILAETGMLTSEQANGHVRELLKRAWQSNYIQPIWNRNAEVLVQYPEYPISEDEIDVATYSYARQYAAA